MKLIEERVEYKDYIGEITYDPSYNSFIGRVINTYPYSIANAEAPTIESLQKEFAISIDIYLEACEEDGDPPIPPGEIVDYDALDEEFYRNPPQWYLDLKAEFAAEDDEAPAPNPCFLKRRAPDRDRRAPTSPRTARPRYGIARP